MWKYVIKRLVLVFFTAFIVLSITFLLYKSLPLDVPLAGGNDGVNAFLTKQFSLGYVIRFTEETAGYGNLLGGKGYQIGGTGPYYYYYTRPIMEQYFNWIGNVFTRWDWGVSSNLYLNQSAMGVIVSKLPVTVEINIIAILIALPLGIVFGIIAALNKDKPVDNVISTVVMIEIALPSFVTILYAILIFGYQLEWLPAKFVAWEDDHALHIASLVIPVMSLAMGTMAGFTRFVRAELCEVMNSDYLLLARTKGLTSRQAIIHHALRNSMVPVVPMVIAEFIGILGGSMVLENLYNIRGVGAIYVDAYNAKDYSLLLANTAFYTLIGLSASVLVDLSYGFIDPRIRMGAK
jgi:oligopeptide transport system permease protein